MSRSTAFASLQKRLCAAGSPGSQPQKTAGLDALGYAGADGVDDDDDARHADALLFGEDEDLDEGESYMVPLQKTSAEQLETLCATNS